MHVVHSEWPPIRDDLALAFVFVSIVFVVSVFPGTAKEPLRLLLFRFAFVLRCRLLHVPCVFAYTFVACLRFASIVFVILCLPRLRRKKTCVLFGSAFRFQLLVLC